MSVKSFIKPNNLILMKQVFAKAPIALLACSALLWASCTKNASSSTTSVSNTTVAAQADASADATFNDVTANVMTTNVNNQALGSVDDSTSSFRQAIAKGHMGGVTAFGPDTTSGTISITITPETPGVFPKTVTVNFGTGFTDLWGNTYGGSISMAFTGPLGIAGNSVTTTFDNYTVNSVGISGTHSITNTSGANGPISFNIQVQNAKVTVGTFWVTWNATHTWTLTAGGSTPRWPFDDVYAVSGSGGGTTSNNFTWNSTITTPLTKAYVCPWFEAGDVKVATNYGTGVLDYGAGTCDNQATVTVGDSTRAITLGR